MDNPKQNEGRVAQLYDRLAAAEATKRARADFTIHKRLLFPPESVARGIVDVDSWIQAHLSLPAGSHILDAGCGVGGTLFALLHTSHSGLGISISPTQIQLAQEEAARRQLASRCRFAVQSYDQPINEQFDLIICVEALIHSQDIACSIENLVRCLKPAGSLLIIEDMATPAYQNSRLTKLFKQSWCINKIPSKASYIQTLENNGVAVQYQQDLSSYVKSRKLPRWLIYGLSFVLNKLPERYRQGGDIFIGGWALQSLYVEKQVQYCGLIAKRHS